MNEPRRTSREITGLLNPTDPVPAPPPDGWSWEGLGVPVPAPFTMQLTADASHMGSVIAHVPNTEYVRWLEVLAVAHSDALGYTESWYREHNLIWFVKRHEIDYLSEVRTGDHLLLATWVEGFEKARSERGYFIVKAGDRKPVVRGRTEWVLVNRTTSRPQRVPADAAEVFIRSTSGA
ncbi:MAG: acyl-CoA thioesterase [Planctomycetota bacterium]